jgi:hypothetical protein
MASDSDKKLEPEWLRSIPLRAREIGFSHEELIECTACRKPNPPTRPSCLYCGASLGNDLISRFDIREPENWENGFNIIVVDARDADAERAKVQVASLLGMERAPVASILAAGRPVPLIRVESESSASSISAKMEALGIKTIIVDDDSLRPTSPPARLRSITFQGAKLNLELFNGGEIRSLEPEELVVVVTGVILQGRSELIEKRKLRGSKVVSETATSSDEPVIDIYSKNDPMGQRIPASGFDFSCLGNDKSLIVIENMKRLTARLGEICPSVRLVEDYSSLRAILEHTWPSEDRRESEHIGFAGRTVAKVSTSSNATQFTRYSRLQWRLYEEKA